MTYSDAIRSANAMDTWLIIFIALAVILLIALLVGGDRKGGKSVGAACRNCETAA
jgi:hypothetical protein